MKKVHEKRFLMKRKPPGMKPVLSCQPKSFNGQMMRYFRIFWIDANGVCQQSDPITRWTDAEMYRLELKNETAHIVNF
jgi:hypothetical protein